VIVKRLKDNAITPSCSCWPTSAFGLAKSSPHLDDINWNAAEITIEGKGLPSNSSAP
jgi:hypothetical protein